MSRAFPRHSIFCVAHVLFSLFRFFAFFLFSHFHEFFPIKFQGKFQSSDNLTKKTRKSCVCSFFMVWCAGVGPKRSHRHPPDTLTFSQSHSLQSQSQSQSQSPHSDCNLLISLLFSNIS